MIYDFRSENQDNTGYGIVVAIPIEQGEDHMDHRSMNKARLIPPCADEREGELPFFSLDGLLPIGQALSVNRRCLIVSLISTNSMSANPVLLQSLVTELQLRVLLPLLESPHYCSHQLLLASLFVPQGAGRDEWLAVMQETGVLLERAQHLGTLRKELKQLYNVLSELRAKLRPFGLGIVICSSGAAYALIALPASPPRSVSTRMSSCSAVVVQTSQ